MQRLFRRFSLPSALGIITLTGACTEQGPMATARSAEASLERTSQPLRIATPTGEYMLIGAGDALPAEIDAQVASAGGEVLRSYPELGIVMARAIDADFAVRAAALDGIESVTEDRIVQLLDPNATVVAFDDPEIAVTALAASVGDDEPMFRYQWAHTAVQSPDAWNAGYTGQGVRVAIIDGGLYAAHPDLKANIDVQASRSFVPGIAFDQDVGVFWHGTHVAGIVAAADNGTGVIGIAPRATLIGVKVLHNSAGAMAPLMAAIMYAAKPLEEGGAGADIINMSLGFVFDDPRDPEIREALKELLKGIDRAARYAHRQGVILIAATGNDGRDFDAEQTTLAVPAQSQHVIGISATAPMGWGKGNRDFGRMTSYSNTGRHLVGFAAPGGDTAYPGNETCGALVKGWPCWVFDLYLSTTRTGYSWSSGTSMASPVAAGIAALVIEQAGHRLAPSAVEARMRQGATDLGAPGADAEYGKGFLNAFGAVGGAVTGGADRKGGDAPVSGTKK